MLSTGSRLKALSVDVALLALCAFFFVEPAYAAVTSLSAADMLLNIKEQVPNLMRMVTAIGYVMGFYFIFYGILKLKQYGEMRTMMASQHSLKGPLVYMVMGALLIYLPSTVQMGTSTFWGGQAPLEYVAADSDQWGELLQACIMVVQLFGVIAFIRGIVMLTQLAGHGGQPGMFGKALTHMIGGIFCINIYGFAQVILATLGLNLN